MGLDNIKAMVGLDPGLYYNTAVCMWMHTASVYLDMLGTYYIVLNHQ
jgi:hypothetical protein